MVYGGIAGSAAPGGIYRARINVGERLVRKAAQATLFDGIDWTKPSQSSHFSFPCTAFKGKNWTVKTCKPLTNGKGPQKISVYSRTVNIDNTPYKLEFVSGTIEPSENFFDVYLLKGANLLTNLVYDNRVRYYPSDEASVENARLLKHAIKLAVGVVQPLFAHIPGCPVRNDACLREVDN